MKYIRTKDGRIVDLEKFINEEKDTPYYKDFEFEEISKDGELKWTAIGTEKCSIKDQIGRRCRFSATLNSEVIKQSDIIEELCDYEIHYDNNGEFVIRPIRHVDWASLKRVIMNKRFKDCKLAIKTDKGLIYVAQMNETTGDIKLL